MRSTPRLAPAMVATLLVGGVAGGLAGCTNRESPVATRSVGTTSVTASVGAGGVQHVTIETTDEDRFVPNTVVVHPGRVSLTLRNTGAVPHTFEIPELDVDSGDIGKKATKTVTFAVDRPGAYPFDCAYHASLHMTGTLRVVSG